MAKIDKNKELDINGMAITLEVDNALIEITKCLTPCEHRGTRLKGRYLMYNPDDYEIKREKKYKYNGVSQKV